MNDYSKLNKVSLEIRNQVEEREHFHQDIELIYVLDGAMTVEVGNQKSELKAEDILVINANKKHWLWTNDKDILYLRLGIAYQLVSDVFQSVDIIFWCDSSKENDKRYEEVRKVLKELLGQYLKGGQTEVSFGYISLCYKVLDIMALHFLVQTGDKENITDKDRFEDRILQINNYIRSNYAQNISLKDLSEKLYLSIGYLSRFFKKNYGMSFAEYLTNIRLYHAVEDLLYTNVPITHVAYDNGFTNAAVFNKAFKKAYGETPSSFRVGMKDMKLYITEWNLTISDRNYMNDTCFKGAYIVKNYLDFYGLTDMAGYYAGSDRMSEHYDSNELLFGGRGVLSKDGILKPAGFAFEFLNRLYPYFVGKGENYLISSNGHGSYGMICHNMRKLSYNYYFTKEDELEKDQMWKYIENQKQLNLKVELDDLESGEYQQKIYRINSDNGNVLGIWGEMGYIRDMDREDVKYFRRVCEPKMLIDNMNVVRHQMEINLTLEPNEITFVRIRKIG